MKLLSNFFVPLGRLHGHVITFDHWSICPRGIPPIPLASSVSLITVILQHQFQFRTFSFGLSHIFIPPRRKVPWLSTLQLQLVLLQTFQ